MSFERFSIEVSGIEPAKVAIASAFRAIRGHLAEGLVAVISFAPDTRSLAQNRLMWSSLRDLSEQVTWFGKKLTADGWKDFITAHLDGQDLVPNMDGTGFIAIGRGRSTRNMTIKEMTAVIELAHCFGAERGVRWSRTSLGRDCPMEA